MQGFFPWTLASDPPAGEIEARVARAWAELFAEKPDRVIIRTENFINSMVNNGLKRGLAEAGIDAEIVDINTPLEGSPGDGLIFNTMQNTTLKDLEELKDQGWDINRILLTPYSDYPGFYTGKGLVLDGMMVWNRYNANHDSDRWRTYADAYRDEFGDSGEIRYVLPDFYDAVYMLKEAIEKTGVTGDPAKLSEERILIRDYCNNIQNFQGIQHTWSTKGGVPVDKPVYIFEIHGREKALIKVVR